MYIKLDALQPSGSFKLRGIGYTCQKAVAEGARCLISSSGGNAGLATAYAGQRLGAPTTVVVPETTPEFIRDRLRSYGATVEVHGSQWSEANERAVALCAAAGANVLVAGSAIFGAESPAEVIEALRAAVDDAPA